MYYLLLALYYFCTPLLAQNSPFLYKRPKCYNSNNYKYILWAIPDMSEDEILFFNKNYIDTSIISIQDINKIYYYKMDSLPLFKKINTIITPNNIINEAYVDFRKGSKLLWIKPFDPFNFPDDIYVCDNGNVVLIYNNVKNNYSEKIVTNYSTDGLVMYELYLKDISKFISKIPKTLGNTIIWYNSFSIDENKKTIKFNYYYTKRYIFFEKEVNDSFILNLQ